MAIGAFIAGLLLAETEYRRQIQVTIQPFQGLLLDMFFVSVGAGLDLSHVLANPVVTLCVAIAFVVIKALILLPLSRAFGLPTESRTRDRARARTRTRVRIHRHRGRYPRECRPSRSRCDCNGRCNTANVQNAALSSTSKTRGTGASSRRSSVVELNTAARWPACARYYCRLWSGGGARRPNARPA